MFSAVCLRVGIRVSCKDLYVDKRVNYFVDPGNVYFSRVKRNIDFQRLYFTLLEPHFGVPARSNWILKTRRSKWEEIVCVASPILGSTLFVYVYFSYATRQCISR